MNINKFILLDVESVPDVSNGRQVLGLSDVLDYDDALKALQCVARNDQAFAQYWQSAHEVIVASVLVFDGTSLEVAIHCGVDSELQCLQWLNQYGSDFKNEYTVLCHHPSLFPFLQARALRYEQALTFFFSADYRSLEQCVPFLHHVGQKGVPSFVSSILGNDGNDDRWLDQNSMEHAWQQQAYARIEQHCQAKLFRLYQLFLRVWVASGTVSTVKYRRLSKAMDALL